MVQGVCQFCGKKFTGKQPNKLYCSRSCQGKDYRRRQNEAKTGIRKKCLFCGDEFVIQRGRYRYCSSECAINARMAGKIRDTSTGQFKHATIDHVVFDDPYAGKCLYFDGLHREGRNMTARKASFNLGF